jgi:predicted nuclease with RNAse H fold
MKLTKVEAFRVLGIDLAGVPHRPTGLCLLTGTKTHTSVRFLDEEILDRASRDSPHLVAIDAPLTLPPGRKSIHDRNGSHFRECDLELRRRKIRFFPITLGPMRVLTERGMNLSRSLEKMGLRTIEIYPGGAQDIWEIPRAKKDLAGLRRGLIRSGLEGLKEDITADELDAATGALVGLLFLQNRAEVYGNFSDGAIIMPRSDG